MDLVSFLLNIKGTTLLLANALKVGCGQIRGILDIHPDNV